MLPRRSLFAILLLALTAAAVANVGTRDDGEAARDINANFLSPELDVEHWTEIFESESREIFQSRRAIVAALDMAPGARVADIGAGTGLFLALFAEAVGPDGRVYANEISPVFLEHLRRRAEQAGLSQVEIVPGSERSTGLAAASVDLVFVCDVYHHFAYPAEMLADIHRALRPDGRLVVVDFERIPGESRDWILEHVRAGKQTTREEITAAGFVFEDEPEVSGLDENYLLRFQRP